MKKLKLYAALYHLGLRRSYVGKMLAISFVGVHVPLVCLIIYLMLAGDLPWAQAQPVLAVVLLATLAGTGATLWALHCLLDPVRLASHALHDYMRGGRVPSLPTGHVDEAGRLMADVQEAVTRLDAALDAVHAERGRLIDERQAHFEMLSRMSHELRTPLNAVIGFSEMIALETLGPVGNPRYLEYAHDITESGGHLLAVISDILDMSKIEAGRLDLDERPVDLRAMASRARGMVQARADAGGITLETELPPGLPPVLVDERRMKQVLLNFLSNAVKFTEPGGRVTLAAVPGRDGGMDITVTDTGIGIAPEDLPKVLTPFGQIESALSRRFEGTGLGLPLSKAIVELHGGRLLLDSRPGQGTTVTVHLPAARVVGRGGLWLMGAPGRHPAPG